jgi:pimeloyl-ACP methyl ester carboxylesterase
LGTEVCAANGVRFNVNRLRTGPPGDRPIVVCIHGFAIVGGAAAAFLVGFNLATDADVICYDLRGHGRSDVAPSGYSINDHAADVAALLDALGITQPVHLVGFSYGGAVATVATMRYPERVASLTLLDGIVPLAGWEKSFYAPVAEYERMIQDAVDEGKELDEIIEDMIVWVMGEYGTSRRRAERVGGRIRRMFEDTSLKDELANEVVFDEEEVSRIRCPVLGVYGDESELYFLDDVLPRLLDDVQMHTIPGANHLTVYWRINEIRPLLREFLGLPASARGARATSTTA